MKFVNVVNGIVLVVLVIGIGVWMSFQPSTAYASADTVQQVCSVK